MNFINESNSETIHDDPSRPLVDRMTVNTCALDHPCADLGTGAASPCLPLPDKTPVEAASLVRSGRRARQL